ncbi:hypothetical protein [Saccharothrix texasensis]|uniref:Uncharacterized protein n=1 Tax=Saccharothrix texasensis TaxID=103734 RepID=A0A3N1HJP8_9PSEU|nr:hypothetical protein [Saccharothrix texasensis]ROP42729.1 hypothetical protein EDD40_8239 [Saccharothrix texasensis]
MDAAQAISLVSERIRSAGADYPTEGLEAEQFWGGWCVFAPVMVADPDPADDSPEPAERSVFLVGARGQVEEVSASGPAEDARSRFEEACLWFGAGQPPGEGGYTGQSSPDFSRFVRPRPPRPAVAYDHQAVDAFAQALLHEHDFPGWLTDRLRELGHLLGGAGYLVARRPDSSQARRLVEFLDPDYDGRAPSPPAAVWRTWPPVDPTGLPDADTEGWLLVPGEAMCDILEDLAAETDAAARLFDTIADRVRQASPWRSCGVADVFPQLVAVRRAELGEADLAALRRLAVEDDAEDFLDAMLATSSSTDGDAQALLRLALDAERRGSEVIDLDAAATAAYRRVLSRLGMAFENDWFDALFAGEDPEDSPLREEDRPEVTGDVRGGGSAVADARAAIALVVESIRSRRLDYPTEGLVADRFEAGWSVYAPVEVDESDPMAFLDMPVGRSVFLVGDSGRVKETSSSVPPRQAEDEFIAEERAANGMIDIEWAAMQLKEEGVIQSFTIVDTPPEEAIAERASRLIEPIVQQLALLGPPGWRRFGAVFAVTASAERGRVRFRTERSDDAVAVPEAIMALVREQREVAARMPAGPWWRLLLTVTHLGETTVEYDYGDQPFPTEDLFAPEHYRDDLAAYPRDRVPAWLADHLAADDGPGEGFEAEIESRRLHADARSVSYGDRSIALDRVEWVRYLSAPATTKRFLGLGSRQTLWYFSLGAYPATFANKIDLEFTTEGKDAAPPEAWSFLVDLARRHLEPRLVARLADRVRQGETVDLGGLRVRREGVDVQGGTLPWSAITDVRIADNRVSIHRAGAAEPAAWVPLGNVNAVLVPGVVAAFTSRP